MILYSAKFHLDPNGDRKTAIGGVWGQACDWAWNTLLSFLPEDCDSPGISEGEFSRMIVDEDYGAISAPGGATIRWVKTLGGQTRSLEVTGATPDMPQRIRRRSFAIGDRGDYGFRIWIIERVEDLSAAFAKIHPQVKQSQLTKDLLSDWKIHRNEVTGKVHRVSLSDIPTLCRRIKAEDRQHDLVLISESQGGVDIPSIARTLTGISEVWAIPYELSWQVSSILGKEWTPHHGAMITFAPGGKHPRPGSDTWDHIQTFLMLPVEMRSLTDRFGPRGVENRVLYHGCMVRNQSISQDFPRLDELQLDRLKENIASLQVPHRRPISQASQKESSQHLDSHHFNGSSQHTPAPTNGNGNHQTTSPTKAEQISTLTLELEAKEQELAYHREFVELAEEENQRLRSELETARAEARNYKQVAESLRKEAGSLRYRQAGPPATHQGEEYEAPDPESWEDVLELVDTKLKGKIILTKNGVRSIKDSPYVSKGVVWEAFSLLAGPFLASLHGRGGLDLVKEADARGWQYNPHTSQTSLNRYGEEYYGQYNGKIMEFGRHLKRGTSHDPKRCFRIHFAYCAETKAIIVNHAGRHLRNTKS